MKNLKPFSGNTHTFLDEVISTKKNSPQDINYKDRVNILTPNVKLLFDSFDMTDNANNHVSLSPFGYTDQNKIDLLKLYTSNNSKLIKFKKSATTVLDNRLMNTCQYCSIDPIFSLDHIVPKNEFPEFAVNPKNLFPSCTTCNSYKSENWRNNNKTLFLNLYLDILPQVQYLYTDLNFSAGEVKPTFYLSNINNINLDFFELLESHYTKLNLLNRFSSKCDDIISELKNSINGNKLFLNRVQIVQVIQSKINDDKVCFGINYYKSILEETLIHNDNFMNPLFI